MSTAQMPGSLILQAARKLGERGFRVVRVHDGDKRPMGLDWPRLATADIEVLTAQFSTGSSNIGVACGPQPNGINLVVIDVDVRDDGLATWERIVAEHGPFPATVTHTTPSGGLHVFFDSPETFRNSRLAAGIDIRGDGGQVVVPPSWRMIDGAVVQYTERYDRSGIYRHPIAALPLGLWEMLQRPTRAEVATSIARHPSQANGVISNADWLRDHWDWLAVLEGQGHTLVRQVGDTLYMRHPTATAEHSAVVHLRANMMNAFSTNMPGPLRPEQVNRDGSIAWSPFDWFTATEHDGDYSAATSEINRRRTPIVVGGGDPEQRAANQAPTTPDATPLFPPPEFYAQRPWMAACQQMAQAVGGSPSAHLLAYLCRWATLIPPGYSIPPINGAVSSFDLLCVIAGTSGSGKTSPMRNAAGMLPVQRTDLRMGLGIGSGEGIIEAFYGTQVRTDDKGKQFKERAKTVAGVNFAVSEGLIFAELAGRGGTTHVTRLCDAWSGAPLSTANASAETFRHIAEDQYRLTLMMGLQADMAHELMTDSAASQGFVGRLLFCWAEEPRVSPRPRPPEPFTLTVPPEIATPATADEPKRYRPTMLTYPDEIYAEIQSASDRRVGTNVAVEEHHHDLMRCKLAGIVALMDGRTTVTVADWTIATTLADHSRLVRLYLYERRRLRQRDGRHAAAVARADTDLVVESVKERQYIATMAESIRNKLVEPMSLGKLTRKVSSDTTRHRFDAALALAVANGWVEVVGQRVQRT